MKITMWSYRTMFIAGLILTVCLCFVPIILPATALGADEFHPCSPTRGVADIFTLDDNGGMHVPDGGAASGWIRVFEDFDKHVLSDEVFCSGNVVQFSASDADGNPNFNPNPDCSFGFGCLDVVEDADGQADALALSIIDDHDFLNFITIKSDPPGIDDEEVPEPAPLALSAIGLIGLVLFRQIRVHRKPF